MTSRILVLVIASDFPAHYVEMQTVWRESVKRQCSQRFACTTHIENAQRFDVWFVKAKPERLWIGDIVNDGPLSDIVEFDREAMTIFVKGEETYIPGILNKTIEAIRACHLTADIRACRDRALSSYAGYIGTSVDGYKFASGAGFLMSRNVVDYLIDNERLLMRDVIDDVAIGKLLEPRFGLVHIDRCWVDNGSFVDDSSHINCSSNIFHFRCETYKHERTVEFMNAALQYICERRSK